MQYKKIFDNIILIFSLVCMAGFFWIFTQMFSGNLEKFVLKYAGYNQGNISASLDFFSVNAESAYLVRIQNSGEKNLFFKNQDRVLPIASLTKLISAIIVIDNLKLDDQVKITKDIEDWQDIKVIKEGEVFFAKNLLEESLIESNNSAIIALSKNIGQEKFVELMNNKVKEIGLTETQFFNETGLDQKNENSNTESNYSTAKDLAKLSKYILQNYPQIFEITKKPEFLLCDTSKTNCRLIKNTNQLLGNNLLKSKIIGGKTGETKNAGGCLLVLLKTKDQDDYLISIILNSPNRFKDTEKIINKFIN